MKILILRFSSIGDIVLTSPVIRCLKRKFPEAEIHYATKKSFYPVVQHNPYLSKIHLLDNSLMNLVTELKEEKFEYVIDLHHNQRTLLVKLLLGVKSTSFDKINFEKWLMVNFKINRLPSKHIVDRYLETCKELGVENDGKGLDYFISKEDEVDLRTLPGQFHNGYIGWVIGAKQKTKIYPAEKVAAAINSPKFPSLPVLLLGGKEDLERGEQIRAAVGTQVSIYNACGLYQLNQSASLVKQASVIITNDTGLMHISAAYIKPMLTIWGNTIPEFGMSPYYGNVISPNTDFQNRDLECRPCSKLGYNICPKGHFACMRSHSDELIVGAIRGKLKPAG